MMWSFLWYSKVNRPHIDIYVDPLPFQFPSHLDHHRASSRVLCAVVGPHQLSLLYTWRMYANSNLPSHPTPPSPLGIHSLCLCLYFCFANSIIFIIFHPDILNLQYFNICLTPQELPVPADHIFNILSLYIPFSDKRSL